ncbi:MAG: hypothetical protein K2J78_08650, partial [Muribaculaceae bacterium]|nr:hypothetical protein [Muribaculaceae bacterium]
DYGYTYTNNHTHLHKYNGKWYIFYHSMELQKDFDTEGGFRNVCVDEIEVDEDNVVIKMADQTLKGVAQIRPLNPFIIQQAETTAATKGVKFEAASDGKPGNMVVSPCNEEGIILVKGVKFDKVPQQCVITAEGDGEIEVRRDALDGDLIASVTVSKCTSNNTGNISEKMGSTFDNVRVTSENIVTVNSEAITHSDASDEVNPYDLYFILKGSDLKFDSWQFK